MKLAGVIGSPVAHSLSPAIHNAAFQAAGIDWVYVAFEVAPGQAGAALDAMRVLGFTLSSSGMRNSPERPSISSAV